MRRPKFFIIIFLGSILLSSCSDTYKEHYQNRGEAVKDGAMKRGWLPNWLPKASTNIDEKHNLDTNAVAFSFDLPDPYKGIQNLKCVASKPPKPHIKLKTFPSNIHKMPNKKYCDGYYLLQVGQSFFVWTNTYQR